MNRAEILFKISYYDPLHTVEISCKLDNFKIF